MPNVEGPTQDAEEIMSSRNVDCTRRVADARGDLVDVSFDKKGVPSIQGMRLLCARRPEEAAADGEAWEAEKEAMLILGLIILEFENAILIFA
jgi:hypothetical protein